MSANAPAPEAKLRLTALPHPVLSLMLPLEYTPAVAATCRLLRELSRQKLHDFRIKCGSEARLQGALAFAVGLPALKSLCIDNMPSLCTQRTIDYLGQLTTLTSLEVTSERSDEMVPMWGCGESMYDKIQAKCTYEDVCNPACAVAAAIERLGPQLLRLNVHGNGIGELEELGELTALTYLDFSGNQRLGGDEATILARMPGLQHLNLCDVELDGALAGLTALSVRTLLLSGNQGGLNDAAAHTLAAVTSLEHLDLRSACFTEGGVSALGTLSRLTHLRLSTTACCGAAPLQALASLPALRCLDLEGTKLENAAFGVVASMTQLHSLGLRSTGADADVATNLAGLTALTSLDLSGTNVSLASVLAIAALPKLAVLGLARAGLTDDAVQPLAALTSVRELDLASNSLEARGASAL